MKRPSIEELKKLLMVKNVVAAVPHKEGNWEEGDQCNEREVISSKTESAKESNNSARRSK